MKTLRTMKTALFVAVLAAVLAAPTVAGPLPRQTHAKAQTWTNVPVVDRNCSTKFKSDPDAHPRTCAIKCAASGFGIWTADGRYLRFDQTGNEAWLALLRKSDRTDHLRANVTGELHGDTIAVESISMQ